MDEVSVLEERGGDGNKRRWGTGKIREGVTQVNASHEMINENINMGVYRCPSDTQHKCACLCVCVCARVSVCV